MAETLGGLVDRLIIISMKLWHVQAEVHAAAREGRGLSAETVKKLDALNRSRNRLMTEIDECLARAVESGAAEVDARVKIT